MNARDPFLLLTQNTIQLRYKLEQLVWVRLCAGFFGKVLPITRLIRCHKKRHFLFQQGTLSLKPRLSNVEQGWHFRFVFIPSSSEQSVSIYGILAISTVPIWQVKCLLGKLRDAVVQTQAELRIQKACSPPLRCGARFRRRNRE